MYCFCLSYIDLTYNNVNKNQNGTVIDLVIPITLTIILINNQTYCYFLSYTTTLTIYSPYKQSNGTVIVLAIPTTLAIDLIYNQTVLLLS
jgi:hypothetical protein